MEPAVYIYIGYFFRYTHMFIYPALFTSLFLNKVDKKRLRLKLSYPQAPKDLSFIFITI